MNDFAEYQKLWMTKGVDDTRLETGKTLAESLHGRINSFNSYQIKLNRFKLVGASIGIILLVFSTRDIKGMSLLSYLGIAQIILSTLLFLVYYLKNQFKISKLDFSSIGSDFLDNALNMLHRQNDIFKRPLFFFFLSLIIGYNLFNFSLLEGSSFEERLLIHFSSTIIIGLGAYVGYFIRMRRIKKEVLPLIKELEQIKEDLKSEN
ncbi:MAG: hypothetical protein EHM93_13985 [Bacteroidales bacterium]|nr:MAG: hypothetical protein EHM93_13985 [Bacteroidales bacterium]